MNPDERRQEPDHRRIAVVGVTGSGKTTLARNIARLLDIRHVELDALHWGPNWTPVPDDVFQERAGRALDGNYSKVRDIVWRRTAPTARQLSGCRFWIASPVTPRACGKPSTRMI